MDICVVTNDAQLARFIVLELKEVGYTAMHSEVSTAARLSIVDLDFISDVQKDCIGFSYDESKRDSVQDFLKRPIDTEKLKNTVAKKLAIFQVQKMPAQLDVDVKTRKVFSGASSVRLSEKEFSLFLKLCNEKIVSREDGAKIFGDGESNVVDVYVHYLRKKLAKIYDGETVLSNRGKGYSLCDTLTVKFN